MAAAHVVTALQAAARETDPLSSAVVSVMRPAGDAPRLPRGEDRGTLQASTEGLQSSGTRRRVVHATALAQVQRFYCMER